MLGINFITCGTIEYMFEGFFCKTIVRGDIDVTYDIQLFGVATDE